MYRLREMEIDDKVCEQVSMTMLSQVYPTAVIERCVRESQPWSTKARRVRASTPLALVLFVIAMAASEPSEPMPGMAQARGQSQRSPPRRTAGRTERCGDQWTAPGLGQPRLAGAHA